MVKVALAHDYLTQRGGAERVFLSMCRAFPDAPIYTSLYEPELTFPEFEQFEIRTTPLNRTRLLRRHHRLALPILASAFSRLEIEADVTLCSSSGWAHGAQATGRKIVYCHNPARWLYQTAEYAGRPISITAAAARAVNGPLRRWDRRAAQSADVYLANSHVVRRRVRAAYDIDAHVVEPPITIEPGGLRTPAGNLGDGFYLCVSRLLEYKNVEAIVEAFRNLPAEHLAIVGRGPIEARLRATAPGNVTLLGTVDEAELRWLYAHSRALVAASYEDFGLTPVEAMAFGKPSVALRYGGFLETIVEGETGVFFDQPNAAAIARAVGELAGVTFAPDILMKRAQEYSHTRFEERLHSAVASAVTGRGLGPCGAEGDTTSD